MNYEEIVAKLKANRELAPLEIKTLVYNTKTIDRVDGEVGHWSQEITSIIKIDNDLWAIDWNYGLCCQDNEFYKQPYRVKKVEKVVAKTEVSYEPIEED